MALEAETLSRRPFLAAGGGGGGGELSAATTLPVVLLATEKDRPVDEVMIWGDEKRMKRELVAWAKAVASMAASSGKNTSSSSPSSPWLSMTRS